MLGEFLRWQQAAALPHGKRLGNVWCLTCAAGSGLNVRETACCPLLPAETAGKRGLGVRQPTCVGCASDQRQLFIPRENYLNLDATTPADPGGAAHIYVG